MLVYLRSCTMRTRFYRTSTKPGQATQGIARKVSRPKLTKDVRAAIAARRRLASQSYRSALRETWGKIDELIENLALAHHKSLRQVQLELHMGRQLGHRERKKTNAWNAFCWKKSQEKENDPNPDVSTTRGKEVLQNLVRNNQDEYNNLSNQERIDIVQEFEKQKATQTKAFRVSTKSRINDATHTLAAVESELNNLKSRTGVETMLFATRGSTDLPMKGVTFATSGVEHFLEGVMKTAPQDFLRKMEGFAVQGIKGAAKNHQQRISVIRADIRNDINEGLRTITSDDTARMEWKLYWRKVVKRYQVIIEGWPDNVPFRNLSEASSPLPDLENLLHGWRGGKTYWRKLSDAEFHELDLKHNAQIENGELAPPAPRRRRSDYGKKRPRAKDGTDTQRKRHKSKKEVEDTDDSSGEENQSPTTLGASHEQSPHASGEAVPQAAPTAAAAPSASTAPSPAPAPSSAVAPTPAVPHAIETSIAASPVFETPAAAPSVAPAPTQELSSISPVVPSIPIDPALIDRASIVATEPATPAHTTNSPAGSSSATQNPES